MDNTPNAVDARVGRNIRFWRVERGKTLLYVAFALGIGVADLTESEAGRRRFSAEELRALCGMMKITPSEIYELRGPRLVA